MWVYDLSAASAARRCAASRRRTLRARSRELALANVTFTGRRFRNAVVVAEVALSFVLLIGTGLMFRTFLAVLRTEMERWMEENEYTSLRQMLGNMSLAKCPDPSAFSRANYMRILQSWRAAVIPILAIPISLIGAVFLMAIAGFTINLLTLLAIVLSVGLVVDDAIVMVENVERHLHLGQPPLSAGLLAARELVGPIIAMTITLAAVYTPVAIQGGLTGALFREFAFTLAGAVLVSGVVALTLSPMMGSRLLRHIVFQQGHQRPESRRSVAPCGPAAIPVRL